MNTFQTIEAAREYATSKGIDWTKGRVCLVTLASGGQAYIVIRGGIGELRVQVKARKIPAIKTADAEFDIRTEAQVTAAHAAYAADPKNQEMEAYYAEQIRIEKIMHTGRG